MYDQGHTTEAQLHYAEKTAAAYAAMEADKQRQIARGHSLMSAVSRYGEASLGDGIFGRISSVAKWGTIWFAMIAPVLVILQVR